MLSFRGHLSSSEQVTVIEEMSQVISSEMGLREQLEVIRIINPTAKVSPTDREFVIGEQIIPVIEIVQSYSRQFSSHLSQICSLSES